jgi:hypothetical protein
LTSRWIESAVELESGTGSWRASKRPRQSGDSESDETFGYGSARVRVASRIPLGGFTLTPLVLGLGPTLTYTTGPSTVGPAMHDWGFSFLVGIGGEVHLGCDWRLRLGVESVGPTAEPLDRLLGGSLGVAYAPSSACRRERAVPTGLSVDAR